MREKDTPSQLRRLQRQLTQLRRKMLALETDLAGVLGRLPATHQRSARNLVHYLAFRRHDVRGLQKRLANLGLSSLGRSEAAVLATIEGVRHALALVAGRADEPLADERPVTLTPDEGRSLLQEHTRALFGPEPAGRFVRIMVTMPAEAADQPELVRTLLERGMNVMRINCAHDGPAAWKKMIANLRRACRATRRRCLVYMDLAGPKLRTGPLAAVPVVKWRPRRDLCGQVVAPALVWLVPPGHEGPRPSAVDAVLPLPASFLARLAERSVVSFRDLRGARRDLRVARRLGPGWLAEAQRTAYVSAETRFWSGRHAKKRDQVSASGLPLAEQVITLRRGDRLLVTPAVEPGRPAVLDSRGQVRAWARIGCTLPQIFADLRRGEAVWLDDGRIGGVIRKAHPSGIEIEITQARPRGEKLRGGKGINLPDSELQLSAVTDEDLVNLRFVVEHADLVGLSFVRSVEDVSRLERALERLGGQHLGMVLKIETRRAFELLPELILAAMRHPAVGVMIARGDLAVECGFERLAEVQEEILWLSEAAHVPVIWATQVLETLAKDGLPSRAEITDAAMGERAECVMLNKGPHISEAVVLLDGILRRMQDHQHKKRAMLRRLKWWKRLAHRARLHGL